MAPDSDISSLRAAAAASVFSRKDIEPVRWVGIFGSFAAEKQTFDSDVDVLVVEHPNRAHIPPNFYLLDDLLPRFWGGRKVDVIRIEPDDDLRGYIAVESLLTSRTLYGSDKDPLIIQLKKDAQDMLDWGLNHFKRIEADIERTRSLALEITREASLYPPWLVLDYTNLNILRNSLPVPQPEKLS